MKKSDLNPDMKVNGQRGFHKYDSSGLDSSLSGVTASNYTYYHVTVVSGSGTVTATAKNPNTSDVSIDVDGRDEVTTGPVSDISVTGDAVIWAWINSGEE